MYLLSGLGRCAHCGGPIHATNSKRGQRIVKVYHCGWNRTRGHKVCPVTVRRPVEDIDRLVLGWIQLNVMKPSVVEAVLAGVRARLEADDEPGEAPELADARAALARVELEVRRFTAALAASDDAPGAIVAAISEREKAARGLRDRIAALEAVRPPPRLPWAAVEAELRAEVGDVARLFDGSPAGGRKALARLLKGKLALDRAAPRRAPGRGR